MVIGIQQFKKYFSAYMDRYVLIGGTACSVAMEEAGLEFRATKDLDIVLVVEAIGADFVTAFWNFINEGGYRNRQCSTGKDVFYRFYSPSNVDFPVMLELFSRVPDFVKLRDGSHLTPIPTSEETASLSAILLDEDYYNFTHSGRQVINGLSVLETSHLIPLKARAWLDLRNRKISGESVDEKNIRKHKNDILRLYQLLTPTSRISAPSSIKDDLKKFFSHISNETVNIKGLKQTSTEEVIENLSQIYTL